MTTHPFRRAAFAALALCITSAPAADPAGKPNRLAKESSPYLLQHAHNPVDWHPWGAEAFEKARKENKLVFLSIGYSSCHWCHVMERESFSDPAVAKLLNDNFVCVKVDREERPDVDEVYMTALLVTNGGGGWPLSLFLTADGKPIFGGTYIPPADKEVDDGKILGFGSVVKRVLDLRRDKEKDLLAQADRVAEMTKKELEGEKSGPAVPLDRALVRDAAAAFDIDPEWGGLGSKRREYAGTKFPRVAVWMFLLRESAKPGNEGLAKAVQGTLREMARGGIYDHLGGGFHRYSTERTWTVPHFEKMLYDNAQLVELYSEAYCLKPDPLYKRVVAETLGFVGRELTTPEGGFATALDADSNGKEGEFYVWTADEVKAALGNDADFDLVRKVYAAGEPNFEGTAYVLRLSKPATDLEKDARLEALAAKLLAVRAKRTRPFLDTKIITGWNGQMVAAYATAGRVFGEKAWVEAARKAADLLLTKVRGRDGRLSRTFAAAPGGQREARGAAYLDDYAYLAHGLLALHDATGEKRWLGEAKAVADAMIKWHADAARGGFYFTAHDHEKLFARTKDSYDGAQPSGNGAATRVLLALARKTGDESYRAFAGRTLSHLAGTLKGSPTSVPAMALALDEYLASDPPLAAVEPAKPDAGPKVKSSADVVAGELNVEAVAGGRQPFSVTLTVEKPYHIYANAVKNKALADAATAVEVIRDGRTIDATLAFPPARTVADAAAGDHDVYDGKIVVAGSVEAGTGPLEVRVRLTACTAGRCLLPAALTLKAK